MRLNFIIGIGISVLSIYYLATKIDAPELIASIKSANLLPLIPAALTNFLAIWIRSLRWKYLLKPVGEVRVGTLFHATLSGYMVNMLLPGRIGELLRAYIVGERDGVSKLSAMATVVVERLVDSFCIVAIVLAVLIISALGFASEITDAIPGLIYYGAGAAVVLTGLLILLLVMRGNRDWALKFFSPLMRILPHGAGQRFETLVNSFLDGLDSLEKSRNLAMVIILSVPLWTVSAIFNYMVISSFGITLPLYGYFFLIITQALGIAVPTPGYMGSYHLAARTGLVWMGINETQAQSLAILLHASFFIPLIIVGLIFWWMGGLSFKAIREKGGLNLTS